MTKRICVLLAQGFEEIEAISVIDILRRAELDVTTVGVDARTVRGAHGISVEADALLADVERDAWDLVYLPGGLPGAHHLRDDARVQALVKKQASEGKKIAAICAAPIALERAGVIAGKRVTSYPGFGEQLKSAREYSEERIVSDGNVVTSRGPGTALELGLYLVSQLAGETKADQLKKGMLIR